MNPDLLIVGSIIAAIPTAGMLILGYMLRRSDALTRVVTETEGQGQDIDQLNKDLRQEREKREALEQRFGDLRELVADDYVSREDYLRFVGLIERKQDAIVELIHDLKNQPRGK